MPLSVKRKTTQVITLAPNIKKYLFDRKTDVSNQKNDPNNISTLFPDACDVSIDYHNEQCSSFGLVGSFKWISIQTSAAVQEFLGSFWAHVMKCHTTSYQSGHN